MSEVATVAGVAAYSSGAPDRFDGAYPRSATT
jgi:hypothetical protein